MTKTRGFSLIEVLAAMALLTIVLLGVYSGISTASRIVHSGSDAIQRMDAIRSTHGYLRSELAQALAVPFAETDDGDPIVFSGNATTLRFVAPLPGYLSRMGPQLQSVSLVRDGDQRFRLEVALSLLPPNGGEPKPLGEPEVLLRGIRKGAFAYRGVNEQNEPGDWQDTWDDSRRTPSMVRLTLDTPGRVAFPDMVAPIRVDPAAARNGLSLPGVGRGPVLR